MTTTTATTSSTTSTATTSTRTSYSSSLTDLSVSDVVEAKVNERLARADTIDAKITANETKITAYQSMQTLLQDLKSASDDLSKAATDVFSQRSASLSSSSTTTASTLLSATISSSTPTGSHTVIVQQVATAERIGSSSQTSRTTALGTEGTLTIGEDGMTAADLTITSDMSLNDIRDAINEQTTTTGVVASVMTVSSGAYMLVLTAQDTNKALNVSSTSSTDLAQGLGLTDSSGAYANELQAAQSAILTVDGIADLQRDSNSVSDVIDGVTLDLTKADTGTTVTLNIDNDTSSVETAVAALVTAYNSWREFVNTNQATNSDGTASSDATLFGDSTLRSISTSIDRIFGNMVNGHSLAEYGLSLNNSHELEVDSGVLDAALTSNFADVQSLFEYQSTLSSSNLTLSSHSGSTYSGTFALNITADGSGTLTSADVGGDTSLFTVSGNTVKGVAGGLYDGLTFYYSGGTSTSITVSLSQGLADQIGQIANTYGNATTGQLASMIADLETQDSTLLAKSNDIKSQAEVYRNYLLDRYATAQSTLSTASQTITVLKALMDSSSSSS